MDPEESKRSEASMDDRETATSNKEQFEHDDGSKTRACGDVVSRSGTQSVEGASTENESLSQLERDVIAKTQARVDTSTLRPGVTSFQGGGFESEFSSRISQAERDTAAKQAVRATSSAESASGLLQLERDVLTKQNASGKVAPASRPGVVSVSTSGNKSNSSLSQMERDVLAKRNAVADPASRSHSSREGSYGGEGPAIALSHIEQDILAKTQARGGVSVPKADFIASSTDVVSAENSNLSQIERDIVAKTQARGPVVTKPGATSFVGGTATGDQSNLSQLERDVLAKTRARGDIAVTKPGVTSVARGVAPRDQHTLSQLERDVLAKTQTHSGATRDFASADESNLSQLERDVLVKTQALGGSSSKSMEPAAFNLSQLEKDVVEKTRSGQNRASQPGAFSAIQNNEIDALSQLERDIVSKSRSGIDRASLPGAVAASTASHLEQNIAAKSRSGTSSAKPPPPSGSASVSALSKLEQDILSKSQGLRSVPEAKPGLVTGSSPPKQLERDMVAKNAARAGASLTTAPGVAAQSLNRLEQELIAKNRAAGPSNGTPSSTWAAPSRSENDATIRPNAAEPPFTAFGISSNLAQLEADIARKNQTFDSREVIGSSATAPSALSSMREVEMQVMSKSTAVQHDQTVSRRESNFQLEEIPRINSSFSRDRPTENESPYTYSVESAPETAATVSMSQPGIEAPLHPNDSADIAGADVAGIEAFVAENVVDATGVAVIMSDEEELIMEKKRQRYQMCFGIICAIGILVAIIVPLTTRGGETPEPLPPTISPSAMPSVAPSFAPTSIDIPELVSVLSTYSDEEALKTRNTPQFKAMNWMVSEDQFVEVQGISADDPKWIQRYIMVVFYFHFQGDTWEACNRDDPVCRNDPGINSWLSSSDECTWFQLGCEDKILTTLNFLLGQTSPFGGSTTPLKGNMPNEVRHLTFLKKFVFPDLELNGPILDVLSQMSDLQVLSLPNNEFTGTIPDTFADEHRNMAFLELSANNFNGTIPTKLGTLQNLTELELRSNAFTGVIPSELGTLEKLVILDLQDNSLHGEIPLVLYKPQYQVFILGGNKLIGNLQAEIGNMTELKRFGVGPSNMTGGIPDELYTLPFLEDMYLHQSGFSGSISPNISKMSTLRDVWLHGNQFSGLIPETIADLPVLSELQLQGNNLDGTIPPSLCNRRGYLAGQISILEVDCNIVCDCCDPCDD